MISYLKKHRSSWTADESARLYLKSYNNGEQYPDGHSYANGGVNLKVAANGKFHSEFIIGGLGKLPAPF
ncbi:hypothetical protein [Mogibacterium sp.]|uniref:hypothetical protein n=1 Tax=Mogibacterium sp. TaxID=2049035 RepID=UPI003FA5A259